MQEQEPQGVVVTSIPSRRSSIGTPLKRRLFDSATASFSRTVSIIRTLTPSISRSMLISARTALSAIPVSSHRSQVCSMSFPMCFHSMTSSFFMIPSLLGINGISSHRLSPVPPVPDQKRHVHERYQHRDLDQRADDSGKRHTGADTKD